MSALKTVGATEKHAPELVTILKQNICADCVCKITPKMLRLWSSQPQRIKPVLMQQRFVLFEIRNSVLDAHLQKLTLELTRD